MTIEHNQISQSELGRRLNMPEPKLRKELKARLIVPDAILCGRIRLFNEDRIPELERVLKMTAKEVL